MNMVNLAIPFSNMEIEAAVKLTESFDLDILKSVVKPGLRIKNKDFGTEMAPGNLAEQQFYICNFRQVPFEGINASQIVLENCQLEKCKVTNSNFKFSDFTGSRISFVGSASSFDSSDFSGTTIYGSHLEGCSFSGSFFYESEISQSEFILSEFIGTSFCNCYFDKMDMARANLDYAEFIQAKFSDVTLPYWSMLHLVRGLPDILSAHGVTFATPNGEHCVQGIQYKEEIVLLRPFLYLREDYLALANSYLVEGENTQAYSTIVSGVKTAFKKGNLSLIRHLCRLASLNNFFSKKEMRKLYEIIENGLSVDKLSPVQYKNYLHELDTAKHILIDCPFGQDTMDITIRTSIPANDYHCLSSALEAIDILVIRAVPETASHIQVRHNSPIEITITVCGILKDLLMAFALLNFLFDKSTTYIERVQNIVLNHKDLHSQSGQASIDSLQKQVADLKKEIDKLKQPTVDSTSLILPGTDEFQRISYKLSSGCTIPKELRAFSISRT